MSRKLTKKKKREKKLQNQRKNLIHKRQTKGKIKTFILPPFMACEVCGELIGAKEYKFIDTSNILRVYCIFYTDCPTCDSLAISGLGKKRPLIKAIKKYQKILF